MKQHREYAALSRQPIVHGPLKGGTLFKFMDENGKVVKTQALKPKNTKRH